MFTGIVSGKGSIQKILQNEDYTSLVIKAQKGFSKNLKKGASVSVNGVCLTSLDDGKKNLNFRIPYNR